MTHPLPSCTVSRSGGPETILYVIRVQVCIVRRGTVSILLGSLSQYSPRSSCPNRLSIVITQRVIYLIFFPSLYRLRSVFILSRIIFYVATAHHYSFKFCVKHVISELCLGTDCHILRDYAGIRWIITTKALLNRFQREVSLFPFPWLASINTITLIL